MSDKNLKAHEAWRDQLSDEQFRITREKGTERAFTGEYYDFHDDGVYLCVCCGAELFDSEHKYDSGSGWPSYYQAKSEQNVQLKSDNGLSMRRTEVVCEKCDAHLGHVFDDGPEPSGKRFCINSASLKFKKR